MMTLDDLKRLALRHADIGPDCAVPGLRVRTMTAPGAPVSGIEEPVFAVVLQGRKRGTIGGRIYEYGPGDSLIVSLALPTTGQVVAASAAEPYLAVGLTLRPAEIAGLIAAADGDAAAAETLCPIGSAPAAVHPAAPQLLDAVGRLLALLDQPDDVRILHPLLEREILWRLLNGPHGPLLREVGLTDSRTARIGRAIRWLQQHYAETVSTQQLETVSGMSASTLFRHFKEFTSMSPLQYQKQIRLHEARMRLSASTRDVAAVAYQVGYESPSQFTREYTRMFGRPPREDLRRVREHAA
jgi:AraC-like DNA-binding protein